MLEQHLKREEVIFPRKEIGKFRGEPVFPRANVLPLKTAENWMRIGRRVKEGVQPMKWVKQRAVTIHRKRAMEAAQQEGEEMLQGLYSLAQTELYVPEPIVDVSLAGFPFSFLCSFLFVGGADDFDARYSRARFQRMISGISSCTRRPCSLQERFISPVRF